MTPHVNLVFDCADPDRLARFWMVALPGYDFPSGPPDGFATWEDWADAHDIPQEQRNAGRTLVPEDGAGRPDIHFIRVPEPKISKNRVHLDVKVGRGLPAGEQRERVEEMARRLVAEGAAIADRIDSEEGFWLVLRDPEGNELCVI